MGHDFADAEVSLSRSSMILGGRNLENREDDLVAVIGNINNKRVKERVIGRSWDVVFVVVKSHITKPIGEIDPRGSPSHTMSSY